MGNPDERVPPARIAQLGAANRAWLIATFVYAVAHLFLLRHTDLGVLMLFFVPPLFAFAVLVSPDTHRMSRAVAQAFLACVGAAIIVGEQPGILPKVNEFPGLPVTEGRILTFYSGVYLLFALVTLPPCLFGTTLWEHKHGHKARFSATTCYLGLLTWLLLLFGFAQAIPRLVHRYF